MLQRPRSQDISGIPLENKSVHDFVENDSPFFSAKQKLNFVHKETLALEENRHLRKFLDRKGDTKAKLNKEAKPFYKSKVVVIFVSQ